jgi:hypothetical protein
LILDIGSELNYKKESESTIYLIAFRELTSNEATSMSVALANKAFSHSLTSEDMTEPTPATDSTPATNPTSRYTSDMFLDIIVDTETSKKSIAGYSQFWALQQLNPAIELELDTSTKEQVTV